MDIMTATDDAIARAAAILKAGGVVAMPTETVYGLAGNAYDGGAVAKIFAIKGRPQFNPLIVHCADTEDVLACVDMSAKAEALAQAFWPGPMTLVLPRAPHSQVSELATSGLETIAVRIPAHIIARKLIKACGFPLVAPSANMSGNVSPTSPQHVAEDLNGRIDMILAAGACSVGVESTVVDLSGAKPIILRPGAVTAEQISDVLGEPVAAGEGDPNAPKSPGLLLKHYAPKIPLRINAIDLEPGEALLGFGSLRFMGIKGGGAALHLPESQAMNLSADGDLSEAAANLFAMMRALDRPEHTGIAVMPIPDVGLGIAINDRLKRAVSSV